MTLEILKDLAVFVAIVGLVYTIWRDWKHKRVQTIMSMHTKWTNKEYSESRTKAYDGFLSLLADKLEGLPESIAIKNQPKISIFEAHKVIDRNDLGIIEHFFDDLGRLAKTNQLDKKLSQVLFKDVTDYWNSIFLMISWEEEKIEIGWHDTQLRVNMDYLYEFWRQPFEDKRKDLIYLSIRTQHR